ncbi:hypothetical protein ACS0TY_015833 [Phlomoides rotata]
MVFLCHGYAMECSISMRGCAARLVKAGYEVYGIDCQGHGKSSGLLGLIPDFDHLVDDLSHHFINISERRENRKKMRILMGESMGGAMVLRLHMKMPNFWDAAVLVAPMCKIADELKPPQIVINILSALARLIPTWKLTPIPDIVDIAFRDPQVRQEVRSNPYTYKGRPRLQTGYQLYKVSSDLEKRLEEVCLFNISFQLLLLWSIKILKRNSGHAQLLCDRINIITTPNIYTHQLSRSPSHDDTYYSLRPRGICTLEVAQILRKEGVVVHC